MGLKKPKYFYCLLVAVMKYYHERLVVLCSVSSKTFFVGSYDEIVFLKVIHSDSENGIISEDIFSI